MTHRAGGINSLSSRLAPAHRDAPTDFLFSIQAFFREAEIKLAGRVTALRPLRVTEALRSARRCAQHDCEQSGRRQWMT